MRSILTLIFGLLLSSGMLLAQASSATEPTPGTSNSNTASASSSDQSIQQAINQKFDSIAALKNVKTVVKDGKVSLTGVVPTNNDREQAKQLAGSLAPNYEVKSDIQTQGEVQALTSGANGGGGGQGGTPNTKRSSSSGNEPKPPR